MSDIAIRVENLGKQYHIGAAQASYRTIRETVMDAVQAPFRRAGRLLRGEATGASERGETIWALKDVSFEVKQGEVVGVIGRNGAGKSTLLKILSRITEPSTGYAEIHGRVGSLLEVGTGFHPELTGRENIALNGAILGMSRADIARRFDEIVAFAEVERFIDTPVKHYSSGMYLRLAFAVAAHLEPEILVVDEVLAVGDAQFQKKCLGKMGEVAGEGRTVIFVSHQMNAIRTLCQECLLLSEGEIQAYGAAETIVLHYLHLDVSDSEWRAGVQSRVRNPYFDPTRFAIVDSHLEPVRREVRADEDVAVLIEGITEHLDSALTVGFAVYSASGEMLFWAVHTDTPQHQWPAIERGKNRLICFLPRHFLNEGDYRIELSVSLHYVAWLSQPGVNAPAVNLSIRGGLSESPYWMLARPGPVAPILSFKRI